jgi:hypothetical protein
VADAVAAEVGGDAVSGGVAGRADRGGDVAQPPAGDGGGDPRLERPGGGVDEAGVFLVRVADLDGDRGVGGPAVKGGAGIDAEQVAVFERRRPGMSCRAASLTEAQITAGNGSSANPGW